MCTAPTYIHRIPSENDPNKFRRVICSDQSSRSVRTSSTCPVCAALREVYDYNDSLEKEGGATGNPVTLSYNKYCREAIYKIFLYLESTDKPDATWWIPNSYYMVLANKRVFEQYSAAIEVLTKGAVQTQNMALLETFNPEAQSATGFTVKVVKGTGGSASIMNGVVPITLNEVLSNDDLPGLEMTYPSTANEPDMAALNKGAEALRTHAAQCKLNGLKAQVNTAQPTGVQPQVHPAPLTQTQSQPAAPVQPQPTPATQEVF